MNAVIFQLMTVLVSAGAPVAVENPLYNELVKTGVAMPDGKTVVPLALPTMKEGLASSEQSEAMTKVARLNNRTLEQFCQPNRDAPVAYKIKSYDIGEDKYRTIDFWFVVYGDWSVLSGKTFGKGLLGKPATPAGAEEKAKQQSVVQKAGYLKADELAARKLVAKESPQTSEYYLYTTLNLFEQAQVSVTRHVVITETPSGVIVAGKSDPRFAQDKEYPNEWRPIEKNVLGAASFGKASPFSGTGFYVKVTRLAAPKNAIFVEYHSVYFEPYGWFLGAATLQSKLPTIAAMEVAQFRAKLTKACMAAGVSATSADK